MKVGFYSPLPPARSGVADYSAVLLRALNVEANPPSCDLGLYHIGNNQLHREIYARALAHPGVAVLHDAVLQHFFLGSLTEQQYVEEFVHNYGEWSRSEAQALWNDRAASAQDPRYFSRPMLRRIAESSRGVIVHNSAAAAIVREHAPDAKIVTIPHFFVPPEAVEPVRKTHEYLFGVFGYLRESKRLIAVLKAFEKLRRARSSTALLIAGEMHSADLERAASPLLATPGVHRIGHMSDRAFQAAAEEVDCCINLRYPSAGETSGIAIRLMGIGKPVMLTESAAIDDFPTAACIRVDSGAAEDSSLFTNMALVAEFPEVGRQIGRYAKEHILRYHSLEAAAKQYWTTLCDFSV